MRATAFAYWSKEVQFSPDENDEKETKSVQQPVYTIIVFLIEPIITNYKEEPPITSQ